ncbi:putative DNA-binding domain-containing protein [Alteromonas sp. ASW11-36]|uniref:DNA-binding domain-containing protein n=1 Tax=Alteromonas arenosi TaxID=3055817 RepID=A0ABT7SVM4_9ALTE|nr:putative DNA-binding domain-containing protein [Alteromonas sp. ASW11-36]MDM7860245.1 putative DNA-binding domain-containing protein [Alteromonas sp. ASW11-36]
MSDFADIQQQFVAHIKEPNHHEFDHDIEDRRLKIYRELFFNNILGFLDNAFPVLKSIYSEPSWQVLARRFFSEHHCRSPYFVDISKEFVEFLANEYTNTSTDPAFLQALAHYEWLELDVSVRKGQLVTSAIEDLSETSTIYFSELASLVSYNFPVHQISPDFQPTEESEPVYLVVYRDSTEAVEFTLVNQVTAFLLDLLEQNDGLALPQVLEVLHQAMPQMAFAQLQDATIDILKQFIQKQVLYIE